MEAIHWKMKETEHFNQKVYLRGRPTSARPDIIILKDGFFLWKTRPKIEHLLESSILHNVFKNIQIIYTF